MAMIPIPRPNMDVKLGTWECGTEAGEILSVATCLVPGVHLA